MTFRFMPALWFDDWGLETTESIVITDSGEETLANVPRKLFVKPWDYNFFEEAFLALRRIA
mgnify:CR=1 FL=1